MSVETFVTPEAMMARAVDGRFTKHALASLLAPEARRQFQDACGRIELGYTEACRALGDPCLASGCSAEGERCLEPLLRAGTEYHKACGAEWVRLFAAPANRDPSWTATAAGYAVA
jgi:hypothetical protein